MSRRNKTLKADCFHLTLTGNALDIICSANVCNPSDLTRINGIQSDAIWDTGSQKSMISAAMAEVLKLPHVTFVNVVGVNGVVELSPVYLINLLLPNNIEFPALEVAVGQNIPANEILVGMDVINQGDFAISNSGGTTTFCFRTPSIGRINFDSEKSKAREEREVIAKKRGKSTFKTRSKRKPRKHK